MPGRSRLGRLLPVPALVPMLSSRSFALLGPVLILSACGVAETAPPAARGAPQIPALPVESVAPAAPAPEPEPEPQERWGAPFAVQSSGRPAPRAPRTVVVVRADTLAPRPSTTPPLAPAVAAVDSAADSTVARPANPARPALPVSRPATAGPAARAPATRTHRVAPGETLWGIARRYGVTVEEVRAANRLEDDRVRIGQTLTIPGGGR